MCDFGGVGAEGEVGSRGGELQRVAQVRGSLEGKPGGDVWSGSLEGKSGGEVWRFKRDQDPKICMLMSSYHTTPSDGLLPPLLGNRSALGCE